VKSLISGGNGGGENSGGPKKVFKLTDDPRVTPIGKFLRRTSLDELPQFLNVLRGQMSLVGPRPPIPYEVRCYDIWHRRRLLAVKPGITGLWQVTARSSVTFDEMVRLDLRYAKSWSLWLDIKILIQTPLAIVHGAGAY
jgi:lipopolysaccharide/colanic/teichoic acid biosynthesis glycosyltransferase